jgi:hypothetical protein
MVINLSKGSTYTTSNTNSSMDLILVEYKEEETMHQMMEVIDLDKHASPPSNQAQDDAMRKHVFY